MKKNKQTIKEFAPIVLFAYNRFSETEQTINALRNNHLAQQSHLVVFADGAKNENDVGKVNRVREYLKTITGFKSIQIHYASVNQGLAASIIQGVSQVIDEYGKVIVLEDDLVTAPNFLDFMNQALDFYSNIPKIHSISGYTMSLRHLKSYDKDYYLSRRASSWGWATWKDRWQKVDWEVKDYSSFKWNLVRRMKFKRGGSDLTRMLKKQMQGKIDSWAIRWCYHQFRQDLYAVFPSVSKVISVGFGPDATHTRNGKRFKTPLDNGTERGFVFNDTLDFNKKLGKQFRRKFSIFARLRNRLRL